MSFNPIINYQRKCIIPRSKHNEKWDDLSRAKHKTKEEHKTKPRYMKRHTMFMNKKIILKIQKF